jgi:hypothetical protein
VPAFALVLAAGATSFAKIGRRYARVFPVPVGEIATRSRPYEK